MKASRLRPSLHPSLYSSLQPSLRPSPRAFVFAALCAFAAACSPGDEGAAPAAQDALPALEETAGAPADPVREALAAPPAAFEVDMPQMNARRGRILFVTNGCVICHQVNGVGGRAAPDLSASPHAEGAGPAAVNPLAFSARIWRGAPAMTALQAIELGYVIDLDAQDLADLAAFAASPQEQALLTLSSTPEGMRDWFLDEPHWRSDDWTSYLQRGERIPGVGADGEPGADPDGN